MLFSRLFYVSRPWANILALGCITTVVTAYLVMVAPPAPVANEPPKPTNEPTASTEPTTTTSEPATTTTEPTTSTPRSSVEPSTSSQPVPTTIVNSDQGRGPEAEPPPGLAAPLTTVTTTPVTTTPTTTTPPIEPTTTIGVTRTTITPRNKATGLKDADDITICYVIKDHGILIQVPCQGAK